MGLLRSREFHPAGRSNCKPTIALDGTIYIGSGDKRLNGTQK